MDLNQIKSPADIRSMSIDELYDLSAQLRKSLLEKLSAHGGHIGPNLGFVEPTVALHYVFDTPEDKIVYDVSHQTYVHKMLTGRMEAFTDPEHYNDVSGFTDPHESPYDLFTIGHTSTSLSLAGGLVKARDLAGGKENIIAVIGDGSLSGGQALEGLDFGSTLGSNFIVVVNDNDMSIAENHGGIYDNLRELRQTNGTASCNIFKAMGWDYRYVAYGNDLRALINTFRSVKNIDHPVVVHIATQKGCGYAPAEANREEFHFGTPFDMASGQALNISEAPGYDDIFLAETMAMMKANKNFVVITAGTPGVLGYTPDMRRLAGSQFVDVGISEQEAMGFASGFAKAGGRPVFGVVSSFLQRAYDQMEQDVAINRTPVVVNIFAGSILAMNDVTHLGWFDIAMVANMPEWVFLAPTCVEEYKAMLAWAVKQTEYPVAVRVPGGSMTSSSRQFPDDYSDLNKFELVESGNQVAVIAAGSMFGIGQAAVNVLSHMGVSAALINPRYLSGIDTDMLDQLASRGVKAVATLEDGVVEGGFGEKIAAYYSAKGNVKVKCYGAPKELKDRYDRLGFLKECRLQPDLIAADLMAMNPRINK